MKASIICIFILASLYSTIAPAHAESSELEALNNQVNTFYQQGKYEEAIGIAKKALDIAEKTLGPDHPDVATSLNNLAGLYRAQGQYAKAEPLYQRSLAIREKTLGPDHPDVATSLNNLAGLYQDQGQYAKAEPLYQRSLAISEKALGPDHPDVAASLSSLAEFYRAQGQYAKAEPLNQRALAIFEKVLGPEHPDVGTGLNNLALLYEFQGQYTKAKPLYQRSLAILEKALGPDHPDVAMILMHFAINFWAQGGSSNMKNALNLLQRSNTIREHHLKLFMVRGSEQNKRDYMATIGVDSNVITSFHLSVGPTNIPAARLALTNVLQRKGRLLDAMSESVATLRRHMKPEDKVLLDQLANISEQRAHLFMQAQHAKIPQEQYFSKKSQLEAQAQELEKTISSRSAEFLAKSQAITLESIQQAIPKDAALVEYLRYFPYNPKAQKQEDQYAPARYIAYVLKSTGDPQSIELGDAAAIDQLVSAWRKTLADGTNSSVAALARKLDEKIMQPVRKLLGDVHSVLISPDGALNLIPFLALKDEHNRYLVEQVALTYLSSGRDLLRLNTKIESQQPVTLLADVDFGKMDNKTKSVPADRSATNRRSGDYHGQFQPLPGTKAEAQAIGKILPAATILTGQQASESKLKQLNRPHILHIATHGFFLSDLPDYVAQTRGVSLMGISQPDLPRRNNPLLNENPLLRSGLALANANRLESGEDDGVLTAMEAANLDLWGTKLVVLSACETGVGEVHNGQGVFGLRRAFVIAGSESQVMSLWKVDDAATKDLMVDYYQRLLAKEGRSDAMRKVQLAMLKSPERNHPFYWASFIVSGDWKPMDGKGLLAVKR